MDIKKQIEIYNKNLKKLETAYISLIETTDEEQLSLLNEDSEDIKSYIIQYYIDKINVLVDELEENPNEETLEAVRDIEKNINLTTYSADEYKENSLKILKNIYGDKPVEDFYEDFL